MSEHVFHLPDVGEGLVEAEIVAWKVAVGDVVELNQPLVDIETAKAVVELPSPYAGTVSMLHGQVGDVIEVDQPLITFDGDSATPTTDTSVDLPAAASTSTAPASVGEGRQALLVGYGVAEDAPLPTRSRRRRAPAPVGESAPASSSATVAPPAAASGSPRSTPPVRLYAKQHGVDLDAVVGTGREGVITREDVERALGIVSSSVVTTPATRPGASGSAPSRFVGRDLAPWVDGPAVERIAVKGVLRSMADAMTQSGLAGTRAAVWNRVDASGTTALLASLKRQPSMTGLRLSPLTIIALAVCDAVRTYPGVNSWFDAAAGEVEIRRNINLGIAADTPRGLIVPNVKQADQMGLAAMAESLAALVEKARLGTTTPSEMLGTTISITNVGPFAVDAALPMIPPGTAAILAVGQIATRPWVVGDAVVPRDVVELTLAFDHRHIDGALASQFIAHVGRFLEDPAGAMVARYG